MMQSEDEANGLAQVEKGDGADEDAIGPTLGGVAEDEGERDGGETAIGPGGDRSHEDGQSVRIKPVQISAAPRSRLYGFDVAEVGEEVRAQGRFGHSGLRWDTARCRGDAAASTGS
jgi:hypothetical protein